MNTFYINLSNFITTLIGLFPYVISKCFAVKLIPMNGSDVTISAIYFNVYKTQN